MIQKVNLKQTQFGQTHQQTHKQIHESRLIDSLIEIIKSIKFYYSINIERVCSGQELKKKLILFNQILI